MHRHPLLSLTSSVSENNIMELRLDVMNKTFWLCKMLLLQFKNDQECKSLQPQVRYKPVAFIAVLEKTATKCRKKQ